VASVFSHALAAAALGVALNVPSHPRIWLLGMACAIVPDLDVVGFWLGVPYHHLLGHRGLTHSLVFAAALSPLIVVTFFRGRDWIALRYCLLIYFFLATASHGLLDALTNGGLGIAFFAPFDNTRYFFPFRPVEVSPLGITEFFTPRGAAILWDEIVWIWIPSLCLATLIQFARCQLMSMASRP
jgi:inner membrane protein